MFRSTSNQYFLNYGPLPLFFSLNFLYASYWKKYSYSYSGPEPPHPDLINLKRYLLIPDREEAKRASFCLFIILVKAQEARLPKVGQSHLWHWAGPQKWHWAGPNVIDGTWPNNWHGARPHLHHRARSHLGHWARPQKWHWARPNLIDGTWPNNWNWARPDQLHRARFHIKYWARSHILHLAR